MNSQLDISFGRKNRDRGMAQALHTANTIHENWSEKAYEFFRGYAERNAKFQTEDVRFAAQGIVPTPKNQRAWGGVARRAASDGIVHNNNNEYAQVKNINANAARSAVWKSTIYQYKKKAI